MMHMIQLLLLIPFIFTTTTSIHSPPEMRHDDLLKVILDKYNGMEPPQPENPEQPIVIEVNIQVLSITLVNVNNMEFTTHMYLRQTWMDSRLAWNHYFRHLGRNSSSPSSVSAPSVKKRLWLPDLYFRNGKHGTTHDMTTPNFLLRIHEDGNVLYSQKITMRFTCQMELRTYPLDFQICPMQLGSYAYPQTQVRFVWQQGGPTPPVTLSENMQIPEYNTPPRIDTEDCTETFGLGAGMERSSCLVALVPLQRQLGSHLAGTYVPAVLIVLVSWLSFWISVQAVPARVTLGLLTLLGILTQTNTVSASLPRVSYIKAVDIWMMSCTLFVVAAMVEFMVASSMATRTITAATQSVPTLKLAEEEDAEVRRLVRDELWTQWRTAKSLHIKQSTACCCVQLCPHPSKQRDCTSLHCPLATVNSGTVASPTSQRSSNSKKRARFEDDGEYCPEKEEDSLMCSPSHRVNETTFDSETTSPCTKSHRHHPNQRSSPIRWRTRDGQILYPRTKHSGRHNKTLPTTFNLTENHLNEPNSNAMSGETASRNICSRSNPVDSVSSELDAYSRFMFPACFLLFSCAYWMYFIVWMDSRNRYR